MFPRLARLGLFCCAILTLVACGSANEPVDAKLKQSSLPAIGQLDELRAQVQGTAPFQLTAGEPAAGAGKSASWFDLGAALTSFWNWASGAIATNPSSQVVGSTVELKTSATDPLAFAVLPVPLDLDQTIIKADLITDNGAGLIGQDGASLIGQDGASLVGPDGASLRTYALANFAEDQWTFVDSTDQGFIDLEGLPGSPADYRSPDGYAYSTPLIFGNWGGTYQDASGKFLGAAAIPAKPEVIDVPSALSGFSVEGVNSGYHVSWDDMGSTNPETIHLFHSSTPFSEVQIDAGEVPFIHIQATDREYVFPGNAGGIKYFQARMFNLWNGGHGPLTEQLAAVAKAGDRLVMTVAADPAEAAAGVAVTITAGGADFYDWDLNDDGIYEITDDPTGIQSAPDPGKPGPQYLRVRGRKGSYGVALRTLSVVRHGWMQTIIEPGGTYLSLTRLADGRPALLHRMGADTRYGYSSDLKGAGTWNVSTIVTDEWGVYGVTNAKLVTANGYPVVMLRANSTAGQLDVMSTAEPLGAGGWVTSQVHFDDDDSDYVTSKAYNPDILGNTNPASSPGTIVLAYEDTDDVRLDPAQDYDIKVAVGTSDGAGGYGFIKLTAVEDHYPDDGNYVVNYPQLARINGIPALLYNETPYGPWVRNCWYTHASNEDGTAGWGPGTMIPELYDVWNRTLFDANGRVAIASNYDRVLDVGGVNYFLSDSAGPALGNLLKLAIPGTEGDTQVTSAFTASGRPVILFGHIDSPDWWFNGWGFLESSTPFGEQDSDWSRATGRAAQIAKSPDTAGIELGDGSFALIFRDSTATDSNLRYSVYF